MAGIQLSALVDTFLATSQAVLTGPEVILNERQRRNYLLYMILRSHDMEDMIQGGDSITDQILFDSTSNYGAYNVLQQKTPALQNHLTETSIQWAFTDTHVTFSKHEKGLNMASQLKRGARAMVFKNIIKAKWSATFVDLNNGMENELAAQPAVGTMETVTTGTRVPYSIFATIHQFGATAGAAPTATVPPGFTTIQGINPTTQPLWRNPVEFYSDAVPAPSTSTWTGYDAIGMLYDRLHFEELAIRPEYGEGYEPEGFIMCSKLGKALYRFNLQNMQDHTRHGPSDPSYPGLNYNGVPVVWREMMDTANVWPATAGAAFGGENDNTLDINGAATTDPDVEGPRYVMIVPKYYKKITHSEHFLEEETPPASVYQPYVRTVYFDCWHNNFCRSRQRAGGVVAPNAAADTAFNTGLIAPRFIGD